jgi:hypothetical protein
MPTNEEVRKDLDQVRSLQEIAQRMDLRTRCLREAEIDVKWVLDRIDYDCHDPVLVISGMKSAMRARFDDLRFDHWVELGYYRWEIMSTAPKDGSMVLAWRTGWDSPSFVRWIKNFRTQTEFWNDSKEFDALELEKNPPTHWLKLPPYPH